MKNTVEAIIKDERGLINESEIVKKDDRDYLIRYTDTDNELVNVSDDEDLLTAYDIANTQLDGNLKFVIEFRKS